MTWSNQGCESLPQGALTSAPGEPSVDVRRGALHGSRRPVMDHAETETAILDRMVRRPQAHLANLDLGGGHLPAELIG